MSRFTIKLIEFKLRYFLYNLRKIPLVGFKQTQHLTWKRISISSKERWHMKCFIYYIWKRYSIQKGEIFSNLPDASRQPWGPRPRSSSRPTRVLAFRPAPDFSKSTLRSRPNKSYRFTWKEFLILLNKLASLLYNLRYEIDVVVWN